MAFSLPCQLCRVVEIFQQSIRKDVLQPVCWSSLSCRCSGQVVLANECPRRAVSSCIAQPLFRFPDFPHHSSAPPHPLVPFSFKSISLYIWLTVSQHLSGFCCVSGIMQSYRGEIEEGGQTLTPECLLESGMSPKSVTLILA